jgi:orotidine-5'-phosphate decarboxylase
MLLSWCPEKELFMPELNFADRLLAAVEAKKSPLVVGLDPSYAQLPAAITGQRSLNDESDTTVAVDAVTEFCNKVLKLVAPHVAAVKINSAFFEQYYWDGVEAFSNIVQEANAHGLIVINDAKRGDIGNTAERYATATLADPGFANLDELVGPDAVTVNPYMGADSVLPFVKTAGEFGKGIFVLVRTSNPGAAEIQDQVLQNGTPLYMHVGKLVEKWGESLIGQRGYSSVGAVVGATNPAQLAELRAALPKTILLVPGYGAQGGTAQDIARAFNADHSGAIVNASRSVIYAYKEAKYAELPWEKAIEQAAIAAKQELAAAAGM